MSTPHQNLLQDLREKLSRARAEVARIEAAISQLEAIYGPVPSPKDRYTQLTFLAAVRDILSTGPKSTDEIITQLIDGGYRSESANFRTTVVNQLNQAAESRRLLKLGVRRNSRWAIAGQVQPPRA